MKFNLPYGLFRLLKCNKTIVCFSFSIALLVLFPALVVAQQTVSISQAATAIREVNQSLLETKNLQMDVNYSLFADYSTTVAFEKETGVFMKQGTNTYSHLLGITSLRNSKMSLTLDSNEQSIVVADPPKKSDLNPSLVDLDSIMKICSSVEFVDLGTQKFYRLHFDHSLFFEYDLIDIYINSDSHFLERLVLYFRVEVDLNETDKNDEKNKPRLEISYSNINRSPVFSAGQFSESRFVSASGKKITCMPAYSNYRLVNNKLY